MRGGEYKGRFFKIHLKLRDQQLIQITIYIDCYIKKPHGDCKPKIYSRCTHKKRKRNPNTTLKIVIKSQENKRRE